MLPDQAKKEDVEEETPQEPHVIDMRALRAKANDGEGSEW